MEAKPGYRDSAQMNYKHKTSDYCMPGGWETVRKLEGNARLRNFSIIFLYKLTCHHSNQLVLQEFVQFVTMFSTTEIRLG